MDIEKQESIKRTVLAVIKEETGKDAELTDSLKNDLGFDSLDEANLCWLLNVVFFNITVTLPEFDGCNTVGDVVEKVIKLHEEQKSIFQ